MNHQNIGFIGTGNMARSLIGGLIASGVDKHKIHAADPNEDTRQSIKIDFDVHTYADNQALLEACDVIIFAVKPQLIKGVSCALRAKASALYLTIAAGIPCASMENWLGQPLAIVRAMPNTPALIQSGASGLFANAHTSAAQKETAESILRAVGLTIWVDKEAQLNAVTALSGSGPAYFFMVMEAMEVAAVKLGLTPETARLLAIQTGVGATKLALEVKDDPASLRKQVTSPGGTTEQAIKSFEKQGLQDMFIHAMTAAHDRAAQLAEELGQ